MGEIADDMIAAESCGMDYDEYMMDLVSEQQAKDSYRKREKRRIKQLRRRARRREARRTMNTKQEEGKTDGTKEEHS